MRRVIPFLIFILTLASLFLLLRADGDWSSSRITPARGMSSVAQPLGQPALTDRNLLSTTGVITGIVTGHQGHPLRAYVSVHRLDEAGIWQFTGTVTPTSANGGYLLAGLSAGRYRIGFDDAAPLPFSFSRYYPQYYNGVARLEDATDVVVEPGAIIGHIDAQLIPKGLISGTAVNQDGIPLSGILVTVYRDEENDGTWQAVTRYIYRYPNITYHTGSFFFDGIDPGVYRLGFSDTLTRGIQSRYYDNAASVDIATDLVITRSEAIEDLYISLAAPTGRIQGIVTGPDGQPQANILVTASESGSGNTHFLATDATGAYTLTGLITGTYYIYFVDHVQPTRFAAEYYDDVEEQTQATPVTLASDHANVVINAQLSHIGQLRGVVRDSDGRPLAGIEVLLYHAATDAGPLYWASAFTWDDGSYHARLPSGPYRVVFRDRTVPPRYFSPDRPENAPEIRIRRGDTVTLDAQLLPLSALTEKAYLPLIQN